jgi:UrcA family protein
MTKSLTPLALVAGLFAATPAFAQTPVGRSVATADLNLASPRGRDVLDRRLDYAARTICEVGQSPDLVSRMNAKRCYRAAISAARLEAQNVIARRVGAPFNVAAR